MKLIQLAYADTDDGSSYEEMPGYKFIMAPEKDSDTYTVYLIEEDSLNKIKENITYYNIVDTITEYTKDYMGRPVDYIKGLILCAIDGDEDGLYEFIENGTVEDLEVLDFVPEKIDKGHNGNIFVLVKNYENICLNTEDISFLNNLESDEVSLATGVIE